MNERRLAVFIKVAGCFVLSSAIVACGSGAKNDSQPPAVGTTFANRVEAVCEGALQQKKDQGPFPYPDFNPTQPDLSKLQGIAEFEAKTVTIFEAWQDRMLALGEPPTGQAAWAEVLKALGSHVRIIVEQQGAALRGDARTFTNDYYEGNKAQEDMVRAADAAGVPECATAAGA
jgi:hypothetical protein